jgi:hypothetical protein
MMPWDLWLIQNPWVKQMQDPWDSNFSQTFAQVADNADMAKVSAKIKNVSWIKLVKAIRNISGKYSYSL